MTENFEDGDAQGVYKPLKWPRMDICDLVPKMFPKSWVVSNVLVKKISGESWDCAYFYLYPPRSGKWLETSQMAISKVYN